MTIPNMDAIFGYFRVLGKQMLQSITSMPELICSSLYLEALRACFWVVGDCSCPSVPEALVGDIRKDEPASLRGTHNGWTQTICQYIEAYYASVVGLCDHHPVNYLYGPAQQYTTTIPANLVFSIASKRTTTFYLSFAGERPFNCRYLGIQAYR